MLIVFAMIASYFKPTRNSAIGITRLSDIRNLARQKKKPSLMKPVVASMCFLMCIVFIPEKATNLASICEKYNPVVACQVW